MKNKLFIFILLLCLGLVGCGSPYDQSSYGKLGSTGTQKDPAFQLAPSHWSDVAKILAEANRLSVRVSTGNITKTQAAQYLNKFRIKLVGNNMVDDAVYAVYLRAVAESQSGRISTQQSKQLIKNSLEGWQRRWPQMTDKPTNPAFANFLLESWQMETLR